MTESLTTWRGEKKLDKQQEKNKDERFGRKERKIDTVISKRDSAPDTKELDYNRPGIEEENFVNENVRKFKKPEDVSIGEYEDFFDPKDREALTDKQMVEEVGPEVATKNKYEDSELYEDEIEKEKLNNEMANNPVQIVSNEDSAHAISSDNLFKKKEYKKIPLWNRIFGSKLAKRSVDKKLTEFDPSHINHQLGKDLKEEHNLQVGFTGNEGNKADEYYDGKIKPINTSRPGLSKWGTAKKKSTLKPERSDQVLYMENDGKIYHPTKPEYFKSRKKWIEPIKTEKNDEDFEKV